MGMANRDRTSALIPSEQPSHPTTGRLESETRSGGRLEVRKVIETRGLTQAQAARPFGVTQPRVGDLVRAKSIGSAWIRSSRCWAMPACGWNWSYSDGRELPNEPLQRR